MKEIPLTQGAVALVDDSDHEELSKFYWHLHIGNGRQYARRNSPEGMVYMHRQLMGCPEAEVDHRNRNSLDNQRDNLRVATRSQQCGNREKYRGDNPYKGVRLAPSGAFQAAIGTPARYLGSFKYAHEAALAYDREAIQRWGEFARLNFPRKGREGRTTVLFVGWSTCGKDVAAEHLGKITSLRYGFSFSRAGLPFMAEVMGVPEEQAYADRHAHREKWKAHLDYLREGDETMLAEIALTRGEVLAGLRDKKELDAARKKDLFSHVVWIHRPGVPVDSTVTFSPGDCDNVILNNGGLTDFYEAIESWARLQKLL